MWQGHCHDQKSERESFIVRRAQLSVKEIRCYLDEGGRLDGKIGADDRTGEEDECRDEEWDEHASIFFYYTRQKEGGKGGRARKNVQVAKKINTRVRGNPSGSPRSHPMPRQWRGSTICHN